MEAAVERLIAAMDAIDGDADAELCVTDLPHNDEGELETDPAEDGLGDHDGLMEQVFGGEPSLGSLEGRICQTGWGNSDHSDCELEARTVRSAARTDLTVLGASMARFLRPGMVRVGAIWLPR